MAEQKGCEGPAFLCCSFAASEIASTPGLHWPSSVDSSVKGWEAGRADSGVKSQRRQERREVSNQKVGSERRKMFHFFKMKVWWVGWWVLREGEMRGREGWDYNWQEAGALRRVATAGGGSWGGWNWTEWPSRWVYSFPRAVKTQVPQLGDLKQQKWILWSWRL